MTMRKIRINNSVKYESKSIRSQSENFHDHEDKIASLPKNKIKNLMKYQRIS